MPHPKFDEDASMSLSDLWKNHYGLRGRFLKCVDEDYGPCLIVVPNFTFTDHEYDEEKRPVFYHPLEKSLGYDGKVYVHAWSEVEMNTQKISNVELVEMEAE